MAPDEAQARHRSASLSAAVLPHLKHVAGPLAGGTRAAAATIVFVGVLVAYVVVTFLAQPLRDSLMIETPRAPAKAAEAPGARAESDRFLANRDTVVVRVPRAMSVGEFLDLYHLRNTRGIREALQRQAGVQGDAAILPADKELRLHLTVPYR